MMIRIRVLLLGALLIGLWAAETEARPRWLGTFKEKVSRALVKADARLRYHLWLWPRGTARRQTGRVSRDEQDLFNRSTHGGEQGAWAVYGKDGSLIARHEVASQDFFRIQPADLLRAYDRAVASASRHGDRVGRVSFTHTHNLLPRIEGWFSPGDRRFATQMRALLNHDGLGQVPFEMVLLYNRSWKREDYRQQDIGRRAFSLPAGLTIRNDLHPGRKVLRLLSAESPGPQ